MLYYRRSLRLWMSSKYRDRQENADIDYRGIMDLRVSKRPLFREKTFTSISHPRLAVIFLAGLLLLYSYAFLITGRAQHLSRFDSIMTQDMAQIARNTIRGQFLITKYITPVGYSYFTRLEEHPDYIRYTLPSLAYTFLFRIFPTTAATIKFFNVFLFFLNGFLLAALFIAIIKTTYDVKDYSIGCELVGWTTAALSSIMIFPYLRIALSDAYEVLTITLVLGIIYELQVSRRSWLLGSLCALLYLCRPNMGLFMPFVAGYLFFQTSGAGRRFRMLGVFAAAAIIILLPFIVRNLYYTGKPVFSLQQTVELNKDIVASHPVLYRSFREPKNIMAYIPEKLPLVKQKLFKNLKTGFAFSFRFSYLPIWLGLPLFFLLYKKARSLILMFIFFVLFHTVVISLFIQLSRTYIPMYFMLTAFGYLGLITYLSSKLHIMKKTGFSLCRIILHAVLVVCICAAVATAGKNEFKVTPDRRTMPPSIKALNALRTHKVKYVYSNIPFWITWYADIITIYAPVKLNEIHSKGPPECCYFFLDKRHKSSAKDNQILRNHASVVENGKLYTLYKFKWNCP